MRESAWGRSVGFGWISAFAFYCFVWVFIESPLRLLYAPFFLFLHPPPPPPSEQTEQESERSACSPLGARPPRSPWIAPERSVATVPQILLSPQFLFDRLGLRERHRLSCSRGSSRRGLTRWHLFGCDFFAVDPRAKRGMLRGIAPAGPNRVCREEQTAFRLGASPRAGGGGMRKT